jgi:hypothetical protein
MGCQYLTTAQCWATEIVKSHQLTFTDYSDPITSFMGRNPSSRENR